MAADLPGPAFTLDFEASHGHAVPVAEGSGG